jgi:hypothetical protein
VSVLALLDGGYAVRQLTTGIGVGPDNVWTSRSYLRFGGIHYLSLQGWN